MVYHRSSGGAGDTKPKNVFRNDGSFLEMFKKLQESGASSQSSSSTESDGKTPTESKDSLPATESKTSTESKPSSSKPPSFVGKRRGGRVLATGKVKKLKVIGQDEEEAPPKDAWSLYLAEVKKYKQTTCEEEGKTRPLVK